MNEERWQRLLLEERRQAEEALAGYRAQLAAAPAPAPDREDAEGQIAQLEARLAAVAQAEERLGTSDAATVTCACCSTPIAGPRRGGGRSSGGTSAAMAPGPNGAALHRLSGPQHRRSGGRRHVVAG